MVGAARQQRIAKQELVEQIVFACVIVGCDQVADD